MDYFTDREFGLRPRTAETIGARVWLALHSLIVTGVGDGSFGYRFPDHCPDGGMAFGCDGQAFGRVLSAEVPWIEWPLDFAQVPDTPVVLDLLEFCAASVGQPVEVSYHPYYAHSHLRWDRSAGLHRFVTDVNSLFARNAIAYELTPAGAARRLLPQPLADTVAWTTFRTGDAETDRLLHSARQRIVLPKLEDRQDALEKLWDAFERLKTLEPGANKKVQATPLLNRVAAPGSQLRRVLEEEAAALTLAGNTFRIRHSETGQELLTSFEQVDHFFARMYAFIHLVLRTTGRGG